jgi:phosphoribosylformylglycinamidine cyclo-ligase
MDKRPLTYEDSGVSINAQDEAIRRFAPAVAATHGAEVLAGVGAFGAAFAPDLSGISEPVFVSSTDGLGTKTLLHSRFRTWEWAGRDIVGCVVNDIIVSGARPAFFLDYLALNKIEPAAVAALVGGIAAGCREIGCALVGGELAEMNDVYQPGEFDLAGFAVGIADKAELLGPERVREGDALIGIASSGIHCNGFSLVRKALAGLDEAAWRAAPEGLDVPLWEAVLAPTVCYAGALAELTGLGVHGAAHISGGGLEDNLPRILPAGLKAAVERNKITVPPVFDIIQRAGNVPAAEMWHVFNMGVGFVVITDPADAEAAVTQLNRAGYHAAVVGQVRDQPGNEKIMWL